MTIPSRNLSTVSMNWSKDAGYTFEPIVSSEELSEATALYNGGRVERRTFQPNPLPHLPHSSAAGTLKIRHPDIY
jgi:hypothetical protein